MRARREERQEEQALPATGGGRRPEHMDALAAEREASEPVSSGFVNLLGIADLREGARYVAGHPRVRALIATVSSFGFTLGGVLVLLAFFGEQVFATTSGSGIAVLWTARGIGSFFGPFVAFRLVGHDQRALRRGIVWAFCALLVCYLGFAISPGPAAAPACLPVANPGGAIPWTYAAPPSQQIVPAPRRGRGA